MPPTDIALDDLLAIPDASLLRGQVSWLDLADHIDALEATGEAPDSRCDECELKCCSYLVRALDSELPGLIEASEALGFSESELLVARSPLEPPGHRTLARDGARGTCVLMDADGRCRLHASVGLEGKPMVCQLYPGQPTLTPTGARIAVRPECTRPLRSRDPDTVATYHRLLRRRVEHRPGMGVQAAPEQVALDGQTTVAWEAYAAWEAEAAAAIRAADSALAGLDAAVAGLITRFSLAPPPPQPVRVKVLAGSLSGVFYALDAAAEADALVAIATDQPPLRPRPASRELIAHALEALEPLRFNTVLAGLGVLRLLVATIDRNPAALTQPREATARVFRQLHIDRIRLPIARSQPATLEALAIEASL